MSHSHTNDWDKCPNCGFTFPCKCTIDQEIADSHYIGESVSMERIRKFEELVERKILLKRCCDLLSSLQKCLQLLYNRHAK